MAEKKQTDDASAEVQKTVDEAEDNGYIGKVPDPTPNERYSQQSDDWRTPETDPQMAAKAGSSKFAGGDK